MNLKDFIEKAKKAEDTAKSREKNFSPRMSLDEISRRIGAYSVSNYIKMQKAIREEENHDTIKIKGNNLNEVV